PAYILKHLKTIQCGNSSVTPLFWTQNYVQNWTAFMRVAVKHFNADPLVGYLRFGLGTGGETFTLYDIGHPGCLAKLFATGFNVTIWDNYLFRMLDFEGTLNSSHQLMVALDGGLGGPSDDTFADIAEHAVKNGIGIGNEN